MTTKISRRKFLLGCAVGTGAVVVACSGLTVFGLHAPVDPSFENFTSGETSMDQKILVTYASKAGSTMEVARSIAEELARRGFAVDILPVKRVTDLSGYSKVIIGSAIRIGSPLPEVKKFVEANREALSNLPTAFFAVYLENTGVDEASQNARLAYLNSIRDQIPLTDEAYFTGVYDPTKISLIEGWMGKMMKSVPGDYRDWKAIANWGQTIFA